MKINELLFAAALLLASSLPLSAQNPIIRDDFTADPSAHYFEGRVYVYPSHDIPAPPEYYRRDWFCMADYHVYSSDNLVDWVDHGVIVDQVTAPWVRDDGYGMWAPDCNYRNGKYYFYFPAPQKPQEGAKFAGNGIGVAVSDTPYGPFVCNEKPIQGVGGIDPCIFVDNDGTPYLAWAGGGLRLARLKDNMTELDSEIVTLSNIPKGMTEGPFLFRRGDKYYYTFPWVEDARESLAYCMSDNPLGPYEFKGKFMEQAADICWTNHHSFVEVDGQWILFYHHNDYSPYFDKNRSVCADYIEFNADGTIKPVVPTHRGIGVTKATSLVQIDRYSDKSEKYVDTEFIDSSNPFEGWKAVLWNTTQEKEPRWISYNRVDFGKDLLKTVTMRVLSNAGGKVELRADAVDGPLLAKFNITGNFLWTERTVMLEQNIDGVHDLYLLMTDGNHIEVDWVNFK